MIIYEAKNKINNKRYIGQTTRTLKDRMRDHIAASKRDKNVSFRFYDDLIKYGEENFEWNILEECIDKEDLDNKESYWIEYYDTTDPDAGYNQKGGAANPFLTDEIKKKIGDAQIGPKNHMYGIKGKDNASSKPIIDLFTGKTFECVSDFCRKHPEFQLSKVCAVCRGDRKTTRGHMFRYIDKNGDIINNKISIQDYQYIINVTTNEKFPRIKDAFNAYKKKNQKISMLYQRLSDNNGICEWNGCIWKYSDIEENTIQKKDKRRYNCKRVKNLTTGKIYDKIADTCKNHCNLATKLRKNNGHCFYKNEEWIILNN